MTWIVKNIKGWRISRILSSAIIYLCLPLLAKLLRPTLDHNPETSLTFARSLFGLAPSGGYRAIDIATYAVRSYRTLSPLPLTGRYTFCGPVPRVAPGEDYSPLCFRGVRTFLCQSSERTAILSTL